MTQVKSLHIYPVKSLGAIDLETSELRIRGLKYDRTWMVSDAGGKFITQRHYPALATIRTELTDQHLILNHPKLSSLMIPLQASVDKSQKVTIWDDQVMAMDEGEAASEWLTQILGEINGQGVRLFRYDKEHIRAVQPRHLKDEDAHTAFADGFPYLVTSVESLDLLNRNLKKNGSAPVEMSRFRPNIVIEGVAAFEEDLLDSLTASDTTYALGIRKPCQRCHVTTIDQRTGSKIEPKEPLRTLLKMNTQPDLEGAHFGQNAVLLSGEGTSISVGDQLNLSV